MSNFGHFGLCQTSWNWREGALSATPPKWLNRFQWNFPEFFYTYCRCAPPILFWGFSIFLSNFGHFRTLSNKLKGGDENYPQFLLNGWIDFNETFQNPFTHIEDVHLLFCFWVFKFFCQILVIFGLCQTSWNWEGGEHYPQLLLNGWIDFNETFQNSFKHIADVHLLFCFGFFKIFCQIVVIFGFCQTNWNWWGWALSTTPPKWLNRFQLNFPEFFYTYCRCAPLILFWGF